MYIYNLPQTRLLVPFLDMITVSFVWILPEVFRNAGHISVYMCVM